MTPQDLAGGSYLTANVWNGTTGAKVIVECGPKGVLTSLNRRIDKNKDIGMLAIEDPDSLQAALTACRSQS